MPYRTAISNQQFIIAEWLAIISWQTIKTTTQFIWHANLLYLVFYVWYLNERYCYENKCDTFAIKTPELPLFSNRNSGNEFELYSVVRMWSLRRRASWRKTSIPHSLCGSSDDRPKDPPAVFHHRAWSGWEGCSIRSADALSRGASGLLGPHHNESLW